MLAKILNSKHLARLDNIKQWQEKDVFKEESVSQHSYKVATYCRILLEDIFGETDDVDILKFKLACNDRAIFHDWDEALILRDISHETKYNDFNGEALRKVLDELSTHLCVKEFDETIGNDVRVKSASPLLIRAISFPGKDVKLFVKLCDWLALVHFIKREMSLGNCNLEEQYRRSVRGVEETVPLVKEMLASKFNQFQMDYFELDNFLYK